MYSSSSSTVDLHSRQTGRQRSPLLPPHSPSPRPYAAFSAPPSPVTPSAPGLPAGLDMNENSRTDSWSGFGPYTFVRNNEKPNIHSRRKTISNYTSLPDDDEGDLPQPGFTLFSCRGCVNVGTLLILLTALVALFLGYPLTSFFLRHPYQGPGFNIGGINATGQVPYMPNLPSSIDKDTPQSAYSFVGSDKQKYELVFSDEFETDGRTFYPGDDPFWEAADLNYWATGDLEWYDPKQITTEGGKLVITLDKEQIHDLNYASGMLTSWNKLCFTTGYMEVMVSLPGSPDAPGYWPAIWTMGNLGRAGYGATTDGTWPYSYDTCDLGTLPSQMYQGEPATSLTDGWDGGLLSNLPGQRLSACTCPNEDHPGPATSNGFAGRGVPEIDLFEAQVDVAQSEADPGTGGEVSQSLQIAPFNAFVKFTNSSPATTISNSQITNFNSFTGTALQQSLSAVTYISGNNYELPTNGSNQPGYAVYGVEWWSDPKARDDGYITWYAEGQMAWQATSASMPADPVSRVSQRLVSEEPMYMIMNLGMSPGFEAQDFTKMTFPAKMHVEYVRFYQRSDVVKASKSGGRQVFGCDPPDYPTADYITSHSEAYTNPNRTTWNSVGFTYPRNQMTVLGGKC